MTDRTIGLKLTELDELIDMESTCSFLVLHSSGAALGRGGALELTIICCTQTTSSYPVIQNTAAIAQKRGWKLKFNSVGAEVSYFLLLQAVGGTEQV